eukprot:scaffold77259_cov64-Phaeocystis_antarctica.AAC.5
MPPGYRHMTPVAYATWVPYRHMTPVSYAGCHLGVAYDGPPYPVMTGLFGVVLVLWGMVR